MGYRNRECEKKFTVVGSSYADAIEALEEAFDYDRRVINASKDYYWRPLEGMKVSFGRLRYMPNGTGQMILKHKDRGTNVNRVEIDVEVDDPDQGKEFMAQLLGEPCGSIYKKYHVLFLGDEHTTVSIYSVRGDNGRVFVEVEAKTEAALERIEKRTAQAGIRLEYEPRSLYEIFFGGKK
jgi:adenylate cyclase class IV